jgi:hypothetical protein
MVKIKINNTEYEALEGLTILDVAKSAGFNIPTLCFKVGLPHYSSCMVCMVKDNRTNNFIPSCSALVQEGMDIDISGDEVISLRSKAIELLLSEHRAECEAPCKIVCPAGYNIPIMNRLIAAKDFEGAIKLSLAATEVRGLHCIECKAYCENACRRKKIDIPISIRNLQMYIYNSFGNDKNDIDKISAQIPAEKKIKRFASRIGKLEASEQKEWLRECGENLRRSADIVNNDSASEESQSCMHCDCRAADSCRLRDLSEEFSVKDPKDKLVNSLIVKKINHKTGLIFENAKCIKCGLCVRLCEELKEEPALCFIHRGFVSIISEPLTEEFDNILKTRSNEVIEICPTGALSQIK